MFPPGGLGSEAGAALEALEVRLAGLVLTDVGEEGGPVSLREVTLGAPELPPGGLRPHYAPAEESVRAVEESVEEDEILPWTLVSYVHS